MTYEEACEYVSRAYEAEGEQRAEFGSGAVSLGYDGNEAMAYYDGYSAASDPEFALAQRIIAERDAAVSEFSEFRTGNVSTDDIPF